MRSPGGRVRAECWQRECLKVWSGESEIAFEGLGEVVVEEREDGGLGLLVPGVEAREPLAVALQLDFIP